MTPIATAKCGLGNMNLATKFSAAMALTLVVLQGIGAVFTLNLQHQTLESLLSDSSVTIEGITTQQIEANKESDSIKAQQLIKMLAQIAPSAIASFDLSALLNYAKVATEDPDISYVAFIHKDGNILGEAGSKGGTSDTLLDVPILSDGDNLGKVVVSYNHNRTDAQIAAVKAGNKEKLNNMRLSKEGAYGSAAITLIVLILLVTVSAMAVAYWIACSITRPLSVAVEAAKRIAEGDLTADVVVSSKDETGQLLTAMQVMLDSLRDMVQEITHATRQLGSNAQQMTSVIRQTSEGARQQEVETDQLATAINQMAATVNEVAHNASEAADAAHHADTEASTGKGVVNDTIGMISALVEEISEATSVVSELDVETKNIGGVLDVIRGIAEQTNLLALNAAIEAARAGEQGRGFAVVADEVRTLASRTQESTQEIQQMIERLQTGAHKAVEVMERSQEKSRNSASKADNAGVSLDSIAGAVATISSMNTQIANAAEEQSSVTNELNRNIISIREVAAQTAESARLTADATHELEDVAQHFQVLSGRFKV